MNLYGKNEEQTKAILGDAWKEIARGYAQSGKALVIERGDLRKKKLELESVDPVRTRPLSSFA
ncbi:hypothetical protein MPNT_50011 [Candidatus Methylacidithermus pantelleriae]|uniref:Uncharacterized protein n=1 Tax=Candidatus Methylacidithermus pantelleriae TaxID=2744239 RepID=A0A8J2BMH0_9BACT|nr:hypothetical protein MPNT_50011 [Candidatus Methylacidithermus pantelleriae]